MTREQSNNIHRKPLESTLSINPIILQELYSHEMKRNVYLKSYIAGVLAESETILYNN